jgi:DNA-binding NarL/FixJ family response regulator
LEGGLKPGRVYDKLGYLAGAVLLSLRNTEISSLPAIQPPIFYYWMEIKLGRSAVSKQGNLNQLTEREHQILLLIARGWNNIQIADTLNLSVRTIKFHTGNIYSKLGVKSRSEAIVWAWEHAEVQKSAEV